MDILYVLLFIIVLCFIISYFTGKSNGTNEGDGEKTGGGEDETRSMFENMVTGGDEDHPDCLVEYYAKLREKMEKKDPDMKDKTIVQMHYTDWCMYCKKIKPVWKKLKRAAPHNPKLKHVKLVQLDQDVCVVPGIKSVPTLIKQTPDGKLTKYTGEKNYKELFNWVSS